MTNQPKLPGFLGPVEWAGPDSDAYQTSGLIHFVRLPEPDSDRAHVPAVVMVHGRGGDESVMWAFARALPKVTAAISVRAPLSDGDGGFSWFDSGETANGPSPETLQDRIAVLAQFLRSLPDLYPIDPARIILMGFSQGAAMANRLILAQPDLAIGVASLSGRAIEPSDPLPDPDALPNFPVFIAHGTRDETIPLQAAQEAKAFYERLGADVTYGEYDVAHKMSAQAIRDLGTWINKVLVLEE